MRRRKNGIVETCLEITAALPWWVGVTFAIVAYSALHHYASIEIQANTVPGQIGDMVIEQMGRTFAYYGQYILPPLFLVGALASIFKRGKRKGLINSVSNRQSENTLRDIDWRDFELLVGEAFRMRGFSVAETGGGGADGGIDLTLKKGGEVFLVQCKHWRAYKVSVNIVRELLGVMASKGAAGGFVVTSGVFTAQAHAFAQGQNIELIDGTSLAVMIEKAQKAISHQSSNEKTIPQEILPEPAIFSSTPHCSQCGNTMIKRVAKKGQNAGDLFWGCASFPKCRGLRAIN